MSDFQIKQEIVSDEETEETEEIGEDAKSPNDPMARATQYADIKAELMRLNLVYHHYLTANVNAIACLDALSGKTINSIVESGQMSQLCLQLMSQDPSDETLVKEEPAVEVPPPKELCKYCKDCRCEEPTKDPPPAPLVHEFKSGSARMVSFQMPEVECERLDRFEIVLKKDGDLKTHRVFLGGIGSSALAVRAVDVFGRFGPFSRFTD